MLDDSIATFLAGRRSIIVASRNSGHKPSLMRAVGARLSRQSGEITVLLARSQSRRLLDDIRSSGHIAVVFSEPSTHRTLQLKGNAARVEDPAAEDLALMVPYADDLAAELAGIGIEPRLARALIAADPSDIAAVRFVPCDIYDQTPGPKAGEAVAR